MVRAMLGWLSKCNKIKRIDDISHTKTRLRLRQQKRIVWDMVLIDINKATARKDMPYVTSGLDSEKTINNWWITQERNGHSLRNNTCSRYKRDNRHSIVVTVVFVQSRLSNPARPLQNFPVQTFAFAHNCIYVLSIYPWFKLDNHIQNPVIYASDYTITFLASNYLITFDLRFTVFVLLLIIRNML